mmetsp:Transcript_28299/g.71036  ORF Transcript_28299/g.71036 Transcript_28299/m.71036 type:complete len:334 (-) Transcript_28299:126-1127(-)|eukprot:CAMPEP_0177679392 /NCGR_PEP_ID=MMETSP0447-20121125/29576_1 /TAXON_ID=0 /ORGANISM="Stygamoeba regulata, Strain BSH-02190019" /LENGTH=333 /DNA_ID=CAMNT_0019188575 /DNA_START=199 /DNA_END=1200 /DNA_ORIENTATION=+
MNSVPMLRLSLLVAFFALLAFSVHSQESQPSTIPMVNIGSNFTVLTIPEDDDFDYLENRYFVNNDPRWTFFLNTFSQVELRSDAPVSFQQVNEQIINQNGDEEEIASQFTQDEFAAPWDCVLVDQGIYLNTTCNTVMNLTNTNLANATAVEGNVAFSFQRIWISNAIPKNRAEDTFSHATVLVEGLVYASTKSQLEAPFEDRDRPFVAFQFKFSESGEKSSLNRDDDNFLRIFSGDAGELLGNVTFVDANGEHTDAGDYTSNVNDGVSDLQAYVFAQAKQQYINFYYAPRDSNEVVTDPTFLLFHFQVGIGSASALQLSSVLLVLLLSVCAAL